MGGAFNLVGDAVAFNFGYFEGGNWTSPPVTIGPDPMTLLYHDAALRSPDSQGKGPSIRLIDQLSDSVIAAHTKR